MDENVYYLWLQSIKSLGCIILKNLLEHVGSATAVYKLTRKELGKIDGLTSDKIRNILQAKNKIKIYEDLNNELRNKNISCIGLLDKNFPTRLMNCPDPPTILFFKGNYTFNQHKVISIVGTRFPTSYGQQIVEKFIDDLPKENLCIVSGLALGIDTLVHKKCIEHQIPSLGILGHGLDTIYPTNNKSLYEKLKLNGGLLTEFLPEVLPDKFNFPRRNRIVAGLAEATIVIETAQKGGSMITANLANDYHRDVFAFPGRITDAKSAGCLQLIAHNKATLITSAEDFVYYMNWEKLNKKKVKQAQLFLDLNPKETLIFNALKDGILTIDELMNKVNLPFSQISEILLALELKDCISWLPGKRIKWT